MDQPWTVQIFIWEDLIQQRSVWKNQGFSVVFTNGVFDLLHRGHVDYLRAARNLGDRLVVGVNTDASVKQFKDPRRPIVTEGNRAYLLSCLRMVDAVTLFDQDTPLELINLLQPDILVKGADYSEAEIVGAKEVKAAGGRVERITLTEGMSSSSLIDQVIEKYRTDINAPTPGSLKP
jgi:D-beta-D-heptose 7-phosphate kinase/D-beta-D-heptose 1-phosphate adenosyltransferase